MTKDLCQGDCDWKEKLEPRYEYTELVALAKEKDPNVSLDGLDQSTFLLNAKEKYPKYALKIDEWYGTFSDLSTDGKINGQIFEKFFTYINRVGEFGCTSAFSSYMSKSETVLSQYADNKNCGLNKVQTECVLNTECHWQGDFPVCADFTAINECRTDVCKWDETEKVCADA